MLRLRLVGWLVLVGVAVVGSAVLAPTSADAAVAPADPLGCAELVFDQSGVASDALATAAAEIATALNADLHVRIEGNLDGDTDGRERRLEAECAGWLGSDGLRVPDLLVVMVSPSERSTSIYYGDDFYPTLAAADAQIQEFVMNPRFKEGSIEGGLLDGLAAIKVAVEGGGVPQAQAPIYDPTDFTYTPTNHASSASSSSSDDDDFPVAGIIGLIVLVLLVTAFSSWAKANGWATSSSSSGYRRSWSSSSSRSFSSSSHHSSSSSHHSSSSSHHSGGGGSSSHW